MSEYKKIGPFKVAPRGILRDATIIAGLLLMNMEARYLVIGMTVFLLGAALHLWSKACLVRNYVVTTTGPYRFARHPFYLANLIIDLGICLISGNPYLLAFYLLAFLLTYIPTIRGEERFLREQHGEEYERYSRQVPLLIPYKLHRIPGPLEASWENVRRENEIARLLRILATPFYFLIVDAAIHHHLAGRFSIPLLVSSIVMAVATNIGSMLASRKAKAQVSDLFA